MKISLARKAALKRDKLLAFARKMQSKKRGYRVNTEGEEDRIQDNGKDFKKIVPKEFNFLYNGPPIKIKRGFEKLTLA